MVVSQVEATALARVNALLPETRIAQQVMFDAVLRGENHIEAPCGLGKTALAGLLLAAQPLMWAGRLFFATSTRAQADQAYGFAQEMVTAGLADEAHPGLIDVRERCRSLKNPAVVKINDVIRLEGIEASCREFPIQRIKPLRQLCGLADPMQVDDLELLFAHDCPRFPVARPPCPLTTQRTASDMVSNRQRGRSTTQGVKSPDTEAPASRTRVASGTLLFLGCAFNAGTRYFWHGCWISSHDSTDPRWVDEAIHLSQYDQAWPEAVETEAVALRPLLEEWITGGVHHVGSTAITGMIAQPVIDITIGVSTLEDSRPCIDVLRGAGWWYAPYRPDTMHWFCRPSPARRTHHLHRVPTGSRWYEAELEFGDYLIAHPVGADRYARLKLDLAARFPNDREAYTDGKSEFIGRINARAAQWRRSAQ